MKSCGKESDDTKAIKITDKIVTESVKVHDLKSIFEEEKLSKVPQLRSERLRKPCIHFQVPPPPHKSWPK